MIYVNVLDEIYCLAGECGFINLSFAASQEKKAILSRFTNLLKEFSKILKEDFNASGICKLIL